MDIMKLEQSYLGGLHGSLRYSSYDKSLLLSMKQAYDGQKNNIIDSMHRAAMHAMDYKIMSGKEVKEFLLKGNNTNELYKDLKKSCEDHHINYMNSNLKKIADGHEVKIGNKIFKSQEAYIEHEIAKPSHEFSDTARISQRYTQQRQIQQQLEQQLAGPVMKM